MGFEEESLMFRHIEDNEIEQDRDTGEEMLIEVMLEKITGLVFPGPFGETFETHVNTENTLLYWKDEKKPLTRGKFLIPIPPVFGDTKSDISMN